MTNRYRSMDTLRALAIILVVLAHSVLSYGAPTGLAPLQLGGSGVDLFFVLSGWLLGSQLFKEISKTNKLDYKRFLVRRWMRTFPAYYAVLFMIVMQQYLTKENTQFPFDYIFFIQNYNFPLSYFSITWSLCVEEQFYLFIALFLTFTIKINKNLLTLLLILVLVIPFFLRLNGYYGNHNETHVSFDGCVLGVLLSQISIQQKELFNYIQKHIVIVAFLSVLIYLFFYLARYYPELGYKDPDRLFMVILFSTWVLMSNKNDYWRRVIYFPGANYIATRSYALYLLHPEALALSKIFFIKSHFVVFFIFTFLVSLILSEVLFRCVERPIMNSREKFYFSKSLRSL